MKTKNFQVRGVTLKAVKWLNPKHGHDRCYRIYMSGETVDVLPLYPPISDPIFVGEIVMISRGNFEVTYYIDHNLITWVCNKKTFESGLNTTLDMYIADNLHKTMIEYNIYYTVDKDDFYYVHEAGLWWLYHIRNCGTRSASDLICCVKDKRRLDYVMRAFDMGPDFILKMYNDAKRYARER